MLKSNVFYSYSKEKRERSQMYYFMMDMYQKSFINDCSWNSLYQWSITSKSEFWQQLEIFCHIKWKKPYEISYRAKQESFCMGAEWFIGGKINFAENLLQFRGEKVAIESFNENGEIKTLSRDQLWYQVARMQFFLRERGVVKGDVVAGVTDNNSYPIVMMLAATSLGAIWSSCAVEFGIDALISRLSQVAPKVLLIQPEYSYGAKIYSCQEKIKTLLETLSELQDITVVSTGSVPKQGWFDWEEVMSLVGDRELKLDFIATEPNHPVYILFSSGTTGAPKCIMHGAAATLIQHKKELQLHFDLLESQKIFFYTTCGWMMWNWVVSALSVGATVVTYEGSVSYPSLKSFFEYLEILNIDVFGGSPKLIASCLKDGVRLEKKPTNLKRFLLTGAPALSPHFDWISEVCGSHVAVCSMSGGTDILSCFMLGNPLLDIYKAELQSCGLGMAVEVWKDESIQALPGESGELVCTSPFISQPVGFWGDSNKEKYHTAYYQFYPNVTVWHHGDEVERSLSGGFKILGRSDATLNPGGVRIGSSELYQVVESLDYILDSLVVGVPSQGECLVFLFILLKQGVNTPRDMASSIKREIRSQISPRHVPYCVAQVKGIPYTLSGKKMELLVKDMIQNKDVSHFSGIKNPDVLSEYRRIGKDFESGRL